MPRMLMNGFVMPFLKGAAVVLLALAVNGLSVDGSSYAASAKSKDEDSHGSNDTHASGDSHGDDEKKGPGPTVVVVPVIVLPITTQDGELLHYGYILIHLEIPNPLNRWDVEANIPYIKDAFIKELHSRSNTIPGTEELNVEGLRQRLADLVHKLVGDKVGTVIFKDIAFPPN